MRLKLFNCLKNENQLISVLLVYILSGILLLRFFQYQINGDGIAYIQIATNYLTNWYTAIDSYHSPLISWLLIPFLIFSQKPYFALYAAKIMSLILGFFTIIGFELLSRRFDIEKRLKIVLMVSMIPIVLYFAFSVITPDLLLVCFLLYYFYFIFDPEYSHKISSALLCGSLGSVAFLAKSYAFPFIIAHFLIFNVLHCLKNKEKWKNILRNLIIGFSVFFIISSLWIGAISYKESKITYGTAGEFNHDLVGPESQGWVTPYLGEPPANVKHWSAFESWSNLKHQLNLIWNNIIQIISIISNFTYFALIIIICYLLLIIRPLNEIMAKDKLLFPFITVLIYAGGFTPVLVEERYLWVVYLLLLLMGAFLLTLLFKNDFFTPSRKTVLTTIFIISFLIMPVSNLVGTMNADKDVYSLSESVNISPNSKIASNNEWLKSSYLAYYWNSEYIGQTKPTLNPTEQIKTLKSHEIDYYIVWDNNNDTMLSQYAKITTGQLNGLRIYDLNKIDNKSTLSFNK